LLGTAVAVGRPLRSVAAWCLSAGALPTAGTQSSFAGEWLQRGAVGATVCAAGAGNANSSAAARGDQRAGTLWWFSSTCALAIPSSNALTALARRLAQGNAKNCRPAIFEAREI